MLTYADVCGFPSAAEMRLSRKVKVQHLRVRGVRELALAVEIGESLGQLEVLVELCPRVPRTLGTPVEPCREREREREVKALSLFEKSKDATCGSSAAALLALLAT